MAPSRSILTGGQDPGEFLVRPATCMARGSSCRDPAGRAQSRKPAPIATCTAKEGPKDALEVADLPARAAEQLGNLRVGHPIQVIVDGGSRDVRGHPREKAAQLGEHLRG